MHLWKLNIIRHVRTLELEHLEIETTLELLHFIEKFEKQFEKIASTRKSSKYSTLMTYCTG